MARIRASSFNLSAAVLWRVVNSAAKLPSNTETITSSTDRLNW